MNNSYDRGSLPGWAEYIVDRIKDHESSRDFAKETDDLDSADQHTCVIDELTMILQAFGIEVNDGPL
jgi:hypothetical protein